MAEKNQTRDWTDDEIERHYHAYAQYDNSPINWEEVSRKVDSRSIKQCAIKYCFVKYGTENQIEKQIETKVWTKDEKSNL